MTPARTASRSLPLTTAALLLLLPLSGCSTGVPTPSEALRVMTFNIRWASPDDGANRWEYRTEWVASIIDTTGAHVIGLQEVTHGQLIDIMARQTRFIHVGVGRDDGLQGGEYAPVLIDTTRFHLVSWDTQWLSSRPDSVGSVGWDAALPRIATRVVLEEKASGDTLRVINTHFDHRGEQARLESARMIAEWAAAGDVALGDFNFEPETEPWQAIMSRGLIDAGESPTFPEDEAGTYRSFDPRSDTSVRIDYVFHTLDWRTTRYEVLDPVRNDAYPSDHLPVLVDLNPRGDA